MFLLAGQANSFYVRYKLDPQLELEKAISRMKTVQLYKYTMKSQFVIEDREEIISEVTGEKSRENAHIKGEMVNTAIDIYFIGRTVYNYDAAADRWLVIASEKDHCEDLLISELNPLSNFTLDDPGAVYKKAFTKVDGVECLFVSCFPSGENQLLETSWKDIEYHFWIDYKNNTFAKAQLFANHQKNPSARLNINLALKNINEEFFIEPPDISIKN
ncbi:MAG: hypothetical protein LBR98_00165 [Syntrophomonadaceae bacterium]|nr:hypothetical protein [Syntrophomonadaceae bacterium]